MVYNVCCVHIHSVAQAITACKTHVNGSSTLVNGRLPILARRMMVNAKLFALVRHFVVDLLDTLSKRVGTKYRYSPLRTATLPITK